MNLKLKEDRTHGSQEYPYDQYHVKNISHPFQIPVHWHDELEIIYIETGELQVKIGNHEYEGRSRDIFFVNPGELHLMGCKNTQVRYYTILFPLTFISFQTVDELELKLLAPLRSNKLLFPEYIEDEQTKEKILAVIQKVAALNDYEKDQEIRQQQFVRQHLQTRMLLLELLQCLAEEKAFVRASTNRNSDLQREILIFIQQHFTEKMTLGMLAEQFHLSEKYISRYFTENFRLSFSHYVIHLRLAEARKLLERTELSVTEVALQVGFSNVSYFIRVFKDAYGTSPLKYKRGKYEKQWN